MRHLRHEGISEESIPHDSDHLPEITFEESKEKFIEQLRELSGNEKEFDIKPFFEDYQMNLENATMWQHFLKGIECLTLKDLQKINPRFKQ